MRDCFCISVNAGLTNIIFVLIVRTILRFGNNSITHATKRASICNIDKGTYLKRCSGFTSTHIAENKTVKTICASSNHLLSGFISVSLYLFTHTYTKFTQLFAVYFRRCLRQWTISSFGFWEGNHITDRASTYHEHN